MKPAAILKLIRPVNCAMMGAAVLVGASIAAGIGIIDAWFRLSVGFAAGFTLTGSAMAVNDYYDREIDSINEPGRPIPSGAITPRAALVVSIILGGISLMASWSINLASLTTAVFTWIVMMVYSMGGKRTGLPGNLLVSTCIATPFVYGGLAIENVLTEYSLLFFAMAFLSNTGREVTKGIVDIEGDRANGIRTIAVTKGEKAAAEVAAAFYVSAVAISVLPIYLSLVSVWYIPLVALTDLGLIHSSYTLMRKPDRENSRGVKNRVLLWMTSGLAGFLAGSFL
jgi:geranylgeranylglycerol-phosphate geranylgeranyltransferase